MSLTRTRKILGGLALTAALSLTAVAGFAQDGGQGQGGEHGGRHKGHKGGRGMRGGDGFGFGGRFFERLNLTDAQKQQIQQIVERNRQSTQALRQRERGTRGEGPSAFDGNFNEAAVRAAAQQRANARVEMEVAHARMMSEIYNVLTAEQKAQLAAERQQRQQRRQERRQRRQSDADQL